MGKKGNNNKNSHNNNNNNNSNNDNNDLLGFHVQSTSVLFRNITIKMYLLKYKNIIINI